MTTRNLRGDKASLTDLAKQAPMITGAVTLGIGALGASSADAALVIQNIDLTSGDQTVGDGEVINDPFTFDLDQDGTDDFVVLNQTPFQKNAFISSTRVTKVALDAPSSTKLKIARGAPVQGLPIGTSAIFTDDAGYTTLFAAGDEVDAGDGPVSSFAEFFDQTGGPFSDIGATGFIGLQLELEDGIHYGWLEVTRGSITAGRAGFQTTPGAAAPIPGGSMNPPAGVPEPAGLPMLAAGAAGIALMQRRRKKSS